MRVLHTSDLHLRGKSHRRLLTLLAAGDYDVWVDTGDFAHEPVAASARPDAIAHHQRSWWRHKDLARRLGDALAGRPALMVPGNHDRFTPIGALEGAGIRVLVDRHADPQSAGETLPRVEIDGVTFAGTRAIAPGTGHWPGEISATQAQRLWSQLDGVDVLLTHGPGHPFADPPADPPEIHQPLPALDAALARHGVSAHLHGHIHPTGGQWRVVDGCLVVNAATCGLRIDLDGHTVERVFR